MTDFDKCGGALWQPLNNIHLRCLRCGRVLKSEEAQERGYGRVCWEKKQKDTQENLF